MGCGGVDSAAAILMPSVWDHYAATADVDAEIVSMMGLGYTLSTLMADPSAYYRDSFALGASLGLDTFWSLDPTLDASDDPRWAPLLEAAAASARPPSLHLFSYEDFGGSPGGLTSSGVPYLRSQALRFGESPEEVAAHVQALVDTPAPERPPVTFLAVTVWSTSLPRLADALAPLAPPLDDKAIEDRGHDHHLSPPRRIAQRTVNALSVATELREAIALRARRIDAPSQLAGVAWRPGACSCRHHLGAALNLAHNLRRLQRQSHRRQSLLDLF